ncbi:MAG: ATP-grasp domain-containing protein [Lentisphaeria bacterium]|nr:ATP-grasp domain-containing protein [Lentisphaeria bacterium]
MKNHQRITVMLTGIGGGGHGEQILKALKLAETDYEIIGCDMSPNSLGLSEVEVGYVVPPASSPDYLPEILRLCRKHKVSALFHGSEPELKVFSANRKQIEAEGIFLPINPESVIATCMDKFKTMDFLKANGFRYPKTVEIEKESDVDQVDFLPAIVKPSVGSGGSSNVFLAQTKGELKMFADYLLPQYQRFIVQEYVGTIDSEYTVGVLTDMDGTFLNSIAVKKYIMSGLSNRFKMKNRTGRTELGDILAVSSGVSQGEIGPFPEVTATCEKIAAALGSRGAINIQCRLFRGEVYVFEINPRFSGTTSLRAMAGYNEPDILVRSRLFHERPEVRFPYRSGLIVRGLKEVLVRNRAQ